jgi:hypothetical protein
MKKTKAAVKRRKRRELKRLRASLAGLVHFDTSATLTCQPGEEDKNPTFEMVAYTGGKMRPGGLGQDVIVEVSGIAADTQVPILLDHERPIGHASAVSFHSPKVLASGEFSIEGDDTTKVVRSAGRGFPWRSSMGMTVQERSYVRKGDSVVANGQQQEGPFVHVTKSTLREISVLAIPADSNTSTSVAASLTEETDMGFKEWLSARGFDLDGLSRESLDYLKAEFESYEGKPDEEDELNDEKVTATVGDTFKMELETLRGQLAAERTRVSKIDAICAKAGHPKLKVGEEEVLLASYAIQEDWTVEQTELKAELEQMRAERIQGPAFHFPENDPVEMGGEVLEANLCLRAGLQESVRARVGDDELGKPIFKEVQILDYPDKVLEAASSRKLKGYGLKALIADYLRARGYSAHFTRIGDTEIRAMLQYAKMDIQATSGLSTVSLPGILSNVANKTMLAAYAAVPDVLSQITNSRDMPDFKEAPAYRLTGKGVFEPLGPAGEIVHGELVETKYKDQVGTYAKMFGLSRTIMRNDDLSAFLQIPQLLGRMAALALQKLGFGLYLNNTGTFFNQAAVGFVQPNEYTGATTALSIDSLTVAERAMEERTDADGEPIGITGQSLLVPPALKTRATQIMRASGVNEFADPLAMSPNNNPHAGKWSVLSTPFLTNGKVTTALTASQRNTMWSLLANPADVPFMTISYLEGARSPTIETSEADFNQLAMLFRGFWDIGVQFKDPNGAIRMLGQ